MSYCPVAGIDVSKQFSDMCILSPDNKIFAQEKIYHDETSINRANALLQKAERLFFSKPVIVMESTSHYHLILFQFFSEHGYDVIVVNPLQSNSMKDFSIRKRKTDRVDAFKLAMMYRTKTLRPSQIPQTATRALRQLCRHRAELLNDVSIYTSANIAASSFTTRRSAWSTKKPTRLISTARRTRTSPKNWTRSVLTLAVFGLETALWG